MTAKKFIAAALVSISILLLATSARAQDSINFCTTTEGYVLDKLVQSAYDCTSPGCVIPLMGENFFCLKKDDGVKPPKIDGVDVCTNPNPYEYSFTEGTESADTTCPEGKNFCYTQGLKIPFCEPTKVNRQTPATISGNLNNTSTESAGTRVEAKVVLVIASVVLLLTLIGAVVWVIRSRKKAPQNPQNQGSKG
jgi:hypothetical protein